MPGLCKMRFAFGPKMNQTSAGWHPCHRVRLVVWFPDLAFPAAGLAALLNDTDAGGFSWRHVPLSLMKRASP